jgi:hypothetical protein
MPTSSSLFGTAPSSMAGHPITSNLPSKAATSCRPRYWDCQRCESTSLVSPGLLQAPAPSSSPFERSHVQQPRTERGSPGVSRTPYLIRLGSCLQLLQDAGLKRLSDHIISSVTAIATNKVLILKAPGILLYPTRRPSAQRGAGVIYMLPSS